MKKSVLILLTVLFIFTQVFAQTATPPSMGDGSSGNPYQIATLDNLYWLSQQESNSDGTGLYWSRYYIQTANIDASSSSGWDSGNGWTPIGNNTTNFTGSYDGGGYSISSLYISRSTTTQQGLFGYALGATIANLVLTTVDISGQVYIGALAGRISGCTITSCYSTGNVNGNGGSAVGGLVGYSQLASIITKCYSNASVTSTWHFSGGLVGLNDGSTISYCYSTGNINGRYQVGGLVGENFSSATVTNSYSTGIPNASGGSSEEGGLVGAQSTSTTSNSFWDTETSGLASSSGGTGKTTAEMKTQSTFTDAGWDFTNTWSINGSINNGYPGIQNLTPMPVELTDFSAKTENEKVELNWRTATEVNNYGFEVQKSGVSSQNVEWAQIGFVNGHGNSNSPKEYSFMDENITAGTYNYRLKQIDNDGTFEYSNVVAVSFGAPEKFALDQNYPNPFNPTTKIKYSVSTSPQSPTYQGGEAKQGWLVQLKVYNELGEEVATLVNGIKQPGSYEVEFDASALASGIYFYKLQTESYIETKKMSLVK